MQDAPENSLPTGALWEQLFTADSVEDYLTAGAKEIGVPSFSAYIRRLCAQRGEVPERVIVRAGIERSFGHSIFRGDRNPSRDTALQLAFGFCADVPLAQSILRHAGHSQLYPRVPRDAAIAHCLFHRIGLTETQQVLWDLGLPLIGGAGK
ncbi:MAG: hypothetical protein VB021_08490 [Oscillospiraceae bacterium]|nr:hypothetical protein [Oscillospiraceae bacterium]